MGPMKVEESSATITGGTTDAMNLSPTPELKRLNLEVVNQVHPDRASNEQDRVLREGLTKEANAQSNKLGTRRCGKPTDDRTAAYCQRCRGSSSGQIGPGGPNRAEKALS